MGLFSTDPAALFVDLDEGRRMLDESARLNLNMSGDEFLAAWDERRIPNPDSLRVQQVASLIHFVR
jgi:hypothetical protein